MSGKRSFALGWSMLVHSALMYFFTAAVSADGMNIIIPSFEAAYGLSRETMNMSAAVAGWSGVIGSLLFAILVMKKGPKIVTIFALLICGAATIALGRASTAGGFTVCLLAMVFMSTGFGWTTTNTLVSNWFVQKRGIAFGLSTMGLPLATAVFVPMANVLIQNLGISGGFTVIGLMMMVLAPVTWFWVRNTPEEVGLAPDGADMSPEEVARLRAIMSNHRSEWTIRRLLRNREAWLISFGYGLLFLVTIGIVSQLVPRLMDTGYSINQAIAFLSCAALIGIFGSFVWGWLDQKFSVRTASIIYCAWYMLGILLLLPNGSGLLTVAAVFVIGIALGGIGNLYPSMVAYTFGRHEFPSVNRMINTIVPIIRPLGFAVVGLTYGLTKSYDVGYIILIVIAAIALVLISMVRRTYNPEV